MQTKQGKVSKQVDNTWNNVNMSQCCKIDRHSKPPTLQGEAPIRLICGATNEWQISRGGAPNARQYTRCLVSGIWIMITNCRTILVILSGKITGATHVSWSNQALTLGDWPPPVALVTRSGHQPQAGTLHTWALAVIATFCYKHVLPNRPDNVEAGGTGVLMKWQG
jgi:hypothetical protein